MKNIYKIDNAGMIFPAATTKTHTSVFRLGAVLTEAVNPEVLQRALDATAPRFPGLCVRIRKGNFRNYFEENSQRLLVRPETSFPCAPITPAQDSGYFMRVLYYGNRISLEVYHALADGTGGMEFLKSLLYQYFTLQGRVINPQGLIMLPEEDVPSCEMEDSFLNYAADTKLRLSVAPTAYKIKGARLHPRGNRVVHGVLSGRALNAVAKANGATVTTYLAAKLIDSIYRSYLQYGVYSEPIVVAVPVNLRNVFPSKTLRNFFAFVNLSVEPRAGLTFDEILTACNTQLMEKSTKKKLKRIIVGNVAIEKLRVSRAMPLAVKSPLMKIGFHSFGENQKTLVMSNMGRVTLPDGMADLVHHFEAILYPTPHSPVNCGIITCGDNMVINFTGNIYENEFIRKFFQSLSLDDGLSVTVYSNEWGMKNEM